MFFGITEPEKSLLFNTYTPRSHQVSKIHLKKSIALLPNGLCCRPIKFTRLIKPLIAILRFDGHIIAIYTGDLINVRLKFDECVENVISSIKLLKSLGFFI